MAHLNTEHILSHGLVSVLPPAQWVKPRGPYVGSYKVFLKDSGLGRILSPPVKVWSIVRKE